MELDLKPKPGTARPSIDRSKDGDGLVVKNSGPDVYEVGDEEKKLLELSKFVETKIPENEWNEIAGESNLDKYVVQEGDWLWKIAQQLFGSGLLFKNLVTEPPDYESSRN